MFGEKPAPRLIRGSSPSIDIKGCMAWSSLVFQATLVVVVLVILVVYTQHQDKVYMLETSVRSLSRSVETAVNMSDTVRQNFPQLDWKLVVNRSIAQNEDAWVNASLNAQRTLRSMENLVQHVDESRMIERYTRLASTITNILASPKVASHIETYSDYAIWVIDASKTEDANTWFNVGKKAIRDVVHVIQSPKTHRMVNQFINSNETRSLLKETKSLVRDARVGIRAVSQVIEQVRDKHVVHHADDLMQQVRDEGIVRKASDMYDRVQDVEDRFGRVVSVGYEFFMGLLRKEFDSSLPAPPPSLQHFQQQQPTESRGGIIGSHQDQGHERFTRPHPLRD